MPRRKPSPEEKKKTEAIGTLAKKLTMYCGKSTAKNLSKVIMVSGSTASGRIKDLDSWKLEEMKIIFKRFQYTDQEVLEFLGR